ncbi:large membrane associated channel [Cryptosporidium bovis]|uniref:large membrane associated channel n=1 Tax=Cryptosporidium bovis TaxID=310047 RepID=UPI003519F788|nr:large membrane associated channel [Cryptosporidium bovis]
MNKTASFSSHYLGITLAIILYFGTFCSVSCETRPKNSNLHFELYSGGRSGLLRQHKLVGELLECTYICHTEASEGVTRFVPGTGIEKSSSRVVNVEEIDNTENKLLSIKCQLEKMEKWSKDISKSLATNLFTVMNIDSWRNEINPKKLTGELEKILLILENKSSNPMEKVLNSVKAFQEYLSELYNAYLDYKMEEENVSRLSKVEEKRSNSQIAAIFLGRKENTALIKLVKVIRSNAEDMKEMKTLMERFLPLVSSEPCINKVSEGLELVQISFFLLNGLNILSVVEEQRIENKFKRDMIRRNLIIQNEIETKTLSMYPKFSDSPNFEQVLDYLFKTVEKSIDEKSRSKLKNEIARNFDLMVTNFGINCPYILTTIIRNGRNTRNVDSGEKLFDSNAIKNCRVAWKEISSYLYTKGQIVPFPAVRLAIKKSLNNVKNSISSWPRNAKNLYEKVIVDEKFYYYFDISNEHVFVSTCLDVLQGEIGVKSIHGLSLDHIIIICFNFYNLLEVFVEDYNYGHNIPENGKNPSKIIRATKKNVTLKTLPYSLRAKALDTSIAMAFPGIIDFPPFFRNDLDRVVIGIMPNRFIETCLQRVDQVFGPSSKYKVEDPEPICSEAMKLLKEYDIMTQNPSNSETSFDIFEQFKILDVTYLPNIDKNMVNKVDFIKNIHRGLNKTKGKKEIEPEGKDDQGLSPLKKLDVVKTYHLLKELHLQWMEQIRSDPRYKGLTDSEIKNNSPWAKQINLWHSLIAKDIPEIRYAATYLNDRPSRFPLFPGDKRGKIKRIKPLEEIVNDEEINPKFRARYALEEGGFIGDVEEDDEFIYDDVQHEESEPTERTREDISEDKSRENQYYDEDHRKLKKKDAIYASKLYTKDDGAGYREKLFVEKPGKGVVRLEKTSHLIPKSKFELKNKYLEAEYQTRYKLGVYTGTKRSDIRLKNGCANNKIPLNWGIRATILYNNMNSLFSEFKYKGKYGPGVFISIEDICYILEVEFKVKGNHFKDVSEVSLMVCFKWFNEYLAKLWGPFGSEGLKNDIKNLCWKSGFRGWL